MCMGGSAPSPPPPPPPAPTPEDPEVKKEQKDAINRRRRAAGVSGDILTGPLGAPGAAPVAVKTVFGA